MRLVRDNGKGAKVSVAPEMDADKALASRIVDGDKEAVRQWLDGHLAGVFGYLQRRLGPGHDALASELTTATFERALRRIKPYARGSARTPMRLWLLRLACQELAHRKGKQSPPAGTYGESIQVRQIRRSIESLPARKQAALSLALFEGLSGEDLAAALGMRLPAAMKLLKSALQDVGKTLGSQLPGAESA
jgi:DNA-directed RNA polymerase specialized sigma24 family protein